MYMCIVFIAFQSRSNTNFAYPHEKRAVHSHKNYGQPLCDELAGACEF